MSTNDWPDLAQRLTDTLLLSAAPIAITFADEAPPGVAAFEEPMPAPTDDGRTGRVPAGCVFWMRAAERTFSTVAAILIASWSGAFSVIATTVEVLSSATGGLPLGWRSMKAFAFQS